VLAFLAVWKTKLRRRTIITISTPRRKLDWKSNECETGYGKTSSTTASKKYNLYQQSNFFRGGSSRRSGLRREKTYVLPSTYCMMFHTQKGACISRDVVMEGLGL
jgi:hypothetical protein